MILFSSWAQTITFLIIEILLFGPVLSLSLIELSVPTHLALGARASLSCRWQLGAGDVLYSVKWYKDGKEFFRHVPRDHEPRRKFPLPGVHVENANELGSKLTLGPASLLTEGRYRCEVSGEGPLFPTVSDHDDIIVVVLPNHGPTISGCRQSYKIGGEVNVTCISGRSRPATQLAWFVNDEPISTITHHQQSDGKIVSSSKLIILLTERHFQKGGLKLKCLATLGSIYWRSYEETAVNEQIDFYKSYKLGEGQPLQSSSGHRRKLHIMSEIVIIFVLNII